MAEMRNGFAGFDLSELPAVDFDLSVEELAEIEAMPVLSSAIPSVPDEDDELFSSLFASSSLAGVSVSPMLAASTVDAIMAQAEDAQSADLAEPPRHLKLVSGGAAAVEHKPRRTAWAVTRLQRIAAAAALAALAVGSGFAYNTPTAYVTVNGADSSVQLGVNVFGVTVSATSSDPAAQEALDSLGVGGMGYEDSLRQVVDSLSAATPGTAAETEVNVEVSSALGNQKARLEDGSTKVLDELGISRPLTQQIVPEGSGSAGMGSSSSDPSASAAKPEPSKSDDAKGDAATEAPAADTSASQPASSPSEPAGGSASGSVSGGGSSTSVTPVPEQPSEPSLPEGPVEDIDYSGSSPVEPAENIGFGREDDDEAQATGELPSAPVIAEPVTDGPSEDDANPFGISSTID